ncbi:MAG: hypothetical protein ACOYMY_06730 [Prochlorococcaceae cyanobacterium]
MTAASLPEVCGHFDGLAPDRPELRGWCLTVEQVWLRAADGRAVAAACREPRADLEAVGLPLFCGFVVPLEALGRPDALLGQRLWASLDAEGLRPLPETQPWRLGAEQLLRIRRQPLLAMGNSLLREQGPLAALIFFADALLDDPDHGPFHERLRHALFRLEEHVPEPTVGTSAQSCGS